MTRGKFYYYVATISDAKYNYFAILSSICVMYIRGMGSGVRKFYLHYESTFERNLEYLHGFM